MKSRLLDYARLMRLHRPIGIWLLLWPTLWALWFASGGVPRLKLLAIFTLGTVLMRSAGCVINDYADRGFDPHVERTRDRPIAAGRVSPREALVLFALLCLAALAVAWPLNAAALELALPAAALAASYPFAKRFHSLPQAHLGIAFSWGIPMAYAAVRGSVPWLPASLLMAANLCWVIAYDTYYAMSDREDDLKIGVKSSAILFGRHDRLVVGLLHLAALVLLALVGVLARRGLLYDLGLLVAAAFAVREQVMTRRREPAACFRAFLDNNAFGAAVLAGLAWDYLLAALAAGGAVAAGLGGVATLTSGSCAIPLADGNDVADRGYCVERDIAYTPEGWPQKLRLDVFMPADGNTAPVVLLIHGGSWKAGHRRDMEPLATALARRGYVAVDVSYRFAPRFRFPAQLQDLQQAVRWVRGHAAALHADPQRLGAWGFSAGAHLAAMLALVGPQDPWGAADVHVQALVGGGTPTDLLLFNDSDEPQLLGATPQQDPALYRHASPVYLVTPHAPPTFLYHGSADAEVPLQQAVLLSDALRSAGVPVQLDVLRGGGHSAMPAAAVEAAEEFLDRTLKP
ncbi:MAG: 4-hydroxybenzoate octaprenyltransferase [Nevskia sp.]|nr:4-hydroxybenzoate octaprenyltransferase [Nevskia sp.]